MSLAPSTIRRAAIGLVGLALALVAAWTIGFTRFSADARLPPPPLPPQADGIVVLTGGAERIETALRMLTEGRAPVLLVSGVGRGTDLAELARRIHAQAGEFGDRVTLGHAATSTTGNAAETAAWARAHGIKRLIVVTAGYHMPRALIEIERSLPGIELYPVPVQPPAMRGRLDLGTVRLLANEYDKLLAARFGLSRVGRGDG